MWIEVKCENNCLITLLQPYSSMNISEFILCWLPGLRDRSNSSGNLAVKRCQNQKLETLINVTLYTSSLRKDFRITDWQTYDGRSLIWGSRDISFVEKNYYLWVFWSINFSMSFNLLKWIRFWKSLKYPKQIAIMILLLIWSILVWWLLLKNV